MGTLYQKIGILIAAASIALASCSEPPVPPRQNSAPEEVKFQGEVWEIPGIDDFHRGRVQYVKFKDLLYKEAEKDKTTYRDLPDMLQKKKEQGEAVDAVSLTQMEQHLNAAVEFLKAATEVNPKYALAFLTLGFSYYQLQKYEDALAALRKVVEIHPNAPNTYITMALCYLNMGKKKEALDCANQALKIDPKNKDAQLVIQKIRLSPNQ